MSNTTKNLKALSIATAKGLEKKHIYLNDGSNNKAMVFDSIDEESECLRGMTMDNAPIFNTPSDQVMSYMTSAYLNTFIRQIVQRLSFGEIAQDLQQGNFETTNIVLPTMAKQGYTTQYTDYGVSGQAGFTANFPNRNIYLLTSTVQYGDLEVATWSAAKIDAIAEKREAAAWIIAQDVNTIGFYGLQQFNGITGKATYGLLSDPNLLPTVASPGLFSTLTANQIYAFIQQMFSNIVYRSSNNVRVDRSQEIILAMTPQTEIWFMTPNTLFTSTPYDFIKEKLFPKLKIVTAIQYQVGDGSAGNKMQMIIPKIGTQWTVRNLFNYKFKAHRVEVHSTYVNQTFSAGTAGAGLALPLAVETATGC